VVDAMKQFKEVKEIFTTLGRYDVVIDLEAGDVQSLGSTVSRMSRIAGVVFTETLVEAMIQGGW